MFSQPQQAPTSLHLPMPPQLWPLSPRIFIRPVPLSLFIKSPRSVFLAHLSTVFPQSPCSLIRSQLYRFSIKYLPISLHFVLHSTLMSVSGVTNSFRHSMGPIRNGQWEEKTWKKENIEKLTDSVQCLQKQVKTNKKGGVSD